MKKQQVHQVLVHLIEKWINQARQANNEGVEMTGLVLAVLMNIVWLTEFSREQAEELSARLKALGGEA